MRNLLSLKLNKIPKWKTVVNENALFFLASSSIDDANRIFLSLAFLNLQHLCEDCISQKEKFSFRSPTYIFLLFSFLILGWKIFYGARTSENHRDKNKRVILVSLPDRYRGQVVSTRVNSRVGFKPGSDVQYWLWVIRKSDVVVAAINNPSLLILPVHFVQIRQKLKFYFWLIVFYSVGNVGNG